MRHLLALAPLFFLSAEGGGGGASAEGGTSTEGAGNAAAPAAVTFATQAEFDAAVQARIDASVSKIQQQHLIDQHFDALFTEHQIPEPLRPIVRSQWEALKPGDDGHRPDPKTVTESDWFKALKPAAVPAEPAKTTGKTPAQATPAEPAKTPPAQKSPTATLPPYLTRAPGATASTGGKGPATNTRDAMRVAAAAAALAANG